LSGKTGERVVLIGLREALLFLTGFILSAALEPI